MLQLHGQIRILLVEGDKVVFELLDLPPKARAAGGGRLSNLVARPSPYCCCCWGVDDADDSMYISARAPRMPVEGCGGVALGPGVATDNGEDEEDEELDEK